MNSIPAADSVTLVLRSVAGARSLTDGELVALAEEYGAARRRVDAGAAVLAQEVARRSAVELGHGGLAARNGLRSAEKLVQKITGVSFMDARALVAAGGILDAARNGDAPWMVPLADAVAAGVLSVAGAAAISGGLGEASPEVAEIDLLDAAESLVTLAVAATPEETAKSARTMRAHLDAGSVADLEAHRRSKRSLKWCELPDGMTRVTAMLDPESAAVVMGALNTALSPRRGGPRFVDTVDRERAAEMLGDSRSNEQLAVDVLVEIVELATRATGTSVDDSSQFGAAGVFGQKSPAVRVHVQAESLRTSRGFAHFEGQSAVVSIATAERQICTTGILPILFDANRPIDVGRTQRLHSAKQRAALTAFWNGCAFGDCDKPPQFTEVHHIEAFDRAAANTTLSNGICLCRFHHMEVHANGWKITNRSDGTYWLIPPPTLDPGRTPIELRSKSPLQRVG